MVMNTKPVGVGIIVVVFILLYLYLVTAHCGIPYTTHYRRCKRRLESKQETEQEPQKEPFQDDFYRDPKKCPSLLNHLSNREAYDRMANKLVTVNNDGTSFMGFHDGSSFNNDFEYCYVNTLDHTRADRKLPCKKEEDVYDFSMIRRVLTGTVHEPGKVFPRDVCIMEVDKDRVAKADVLEMGRYIDRHDNAHLLQSIDDYKNQLSKFVKRTNKLQTENEELELSLRRAADAQRTCATEKRQLRLERLLLASQVRALKNNLVILGENFTEYTDSNDVLPYLELNLTTGLKEIQIPRDFSITYLFFPRNKKVRLLRRDGSYQDFSQDSPGYPNIQGIDTGNVTMARVLDINL